MNDEVSIMVGLPVARRRQDRRTGARINQALHDTIVRWAKRHSVEGISLNFSDAVRALLIRALRADGEEIRESRPDEES